MTLLLKEIKYIANKIITNALCYSVFILHSTFDQGKERGKLMEKSFIGLSKKNAQDLAENNNLIFRLVSLNGELYLGYPDENDKRSDRICVEIDKGKVTKASLQ